jgi:hypothetical protein
MAVYLQKYPMISARKVKPDRDLESWLDWSFKKLQPTLRVERRIFLSNSPELRDRSRSIRSKNSEIHN